VGRTWFGGAGERAEALGRHTSRPGGEGAAGLLLAERRLAEAKALGAVAAEQTGARWRTEEPPEKNNRLVDTYTYS